MPVTTPTGFRRLTPSHLSATATADAFAGLPDGVTHPRQLLTVLKAAASALGLGARLVLTIDWLFQLTQPQDWEAGARPIVWPSIARQREAFGLSARQVKAITRALIEHGLVTMRDSPNGKRYGWRDQGGRIVVAHGFDLSPLAVRHAEFVRLVKAAEAEQAERARLRRRATIARRGITQILETAAEFGFTGEEWTTLSNELQRLGLAARQAEQVEELAFAVEGLERRQVAARQRLETLLDLAPPRPPESVETAPKGAENRTHKYFYNPPLNPEQDTVKPAQEGCRSQAAAVRSEGPGTAAQLTTDEITRLAPRLRTYLKTLNPAWPDIVDAADWLRGELGVSRSLWGEACIAMGREQAAIAVAIVSAKPAGHFRSSPGAYLRGMVVKAKVGELNLARTIWGLRHGAASR